MHLILKQVKYVKNILEFAIFRKFYNSRNTGALGMLFAYLPVNKTCCTFLIKNVSLNVIHKLFSVWAVPYAFVISSTCDPARSIYPGKEMDTS
jgi:hypothetical protein